MNLHIFFIYLLLKCQHPQKQSWNIAMPIRSFSRISASSAMLLALAGCVPASETPRQLTDDLNRHYAGRPAIEFFDAFGRPTGEFSNPRGAIYRWVSTHDGKPSGNVARQIYTSPSTNYEIVDNYRGMTENYYCELRVYVDQADVIDHFAVAVDSSGKWSSSRCTEIFANATYLPK